MAEWVAKIGNTIGWNGEVVILPDDRLPPHLVAPQRWEQDLTTDSTRLREELGFEELVSLDEGLERTIRWERSTPPESIDSAAFDYEAEDQALAHADS